MSKTGEVCTNQREHGVDIEWTINDFSSLSEKDGVGYWSPLFSFDDYSWFLGIYPNGARSTDSIGHIDLYLELNKKISDHPIRVDFSIALKTANGQKDQERHFTKDFNGRNRHDFLRFITRSDLSMRESELISSGVLTVVCTMKRIRQTMCKSSGSASNTATSDCCYCNVIFDAGYISSHQKKCMDRPVKCPDCFEVVKLRKWLDDHECQNERTEDEACTSESCINLHEKRVLHDLKELFLKKEYCDVVVKVKGREFLAHRNILKARSPVFASIFEHDSVENAICTVEIDDCDPSCFSDFLCFLYCGEITRLRFGEIFRKVWNSSMTLSNITSGFQATGIFPFDPIIIPDEPFVPSDITAIPEPTAEGKENAPNLETATDVEAPVNNIPSPVIGTSFIPCYIILDGKFLHQRVIDSNCKKEEDTTSPGDKLKSHQSGKILVQHDAI